ncbi:hypothetical protein ASG73_11070 [Janibacter sp. Soil728]|uniref:septation protein SepH n=1 Tax=Janibacter sp. Soil728 TaxID=1736393 RepID=UPI0006FA4322|nr:septation protein SepH [Janibacter sp. Soil728]KRE36869.1 hypothetical protein ASG73_11070 [Janibacter sp. Soil728]
MRDLRLIGVHDDGEHLVVTDDAGEEYRLRIDEPLRAAARRDRPRLGQLQIAIDNDVRPREVQAMIRAGASAEEVAARTGWDLDKIARFEGPVIAEREHIASRAQTVRMRGTNQAGSPETLAQRAATRLTGRGVEPSSVAWDAYRDPEGQWSVSAIFAAGGRERTATWWFDMAGMSVVAKNDEAKWLSEADTPAGPVPVGVHRPTAVFDVEVEETKVERATRANTDDLINSMREHSGAKNRRRGGRRKGRGSDPTPPVTEDELPLDELPPPASGTHPQDEKPRDKSSATPKAAAATAAPTSEPATPKPATSKPELMSDDAATSETGTGGTQQSTTAAPAAEMKAEHEPDADPVDTQEESADMTDAADRPDPTQVPEPTKAVESGQGKDESETAKPDGDRAGTQTADAAEASTETADTEAGAKGRGGRKGRAKVPSWDDVMFGTTRD